MQIRFITLREQNVVFTIVLVKEHVFHNPVEQRDLVAELSLLFDMPVILCGDHSGRYYGRKDIANFLAAQLHPSRIRWGTMEVSQPIVGC